MQTTGMNSQVHSTEDLTVRLIPLGPSHHTLNLSPLLSPFLDISDSGSVGSGPERSTSLSNVSLLLKTQMWLLFMGSVCTNKELHLFVDCSAQDDNYVLKRAHMCSTHLLEVATVLPLSVY